MAVGPLYPQAEGGGIASQAHGTYAKPVDPIQ